MTCLRMTGMMIVLPQEEIDLRVLSEIAQTRLIHLLRARLSHDRSQKTRELKCSLSSAKKRGKSMMRLINAFTGEPGLDSE
jgi:hypothetical protein